MGSSYRLLPDCGLPANTFKTNTMIAAFVLALCLFMTYIVMKGYINAVTSSTVVANWYENMQQFMTVVTCLLWGLFYYLTH